MKRKKILLILAIVIGIISLFFGGYFIYNKLNNSKNENKTQEQTKQNEDNVIDDNNNLITDEDNTDNNKKNSNDNSSYENNISDNQIKEDKEKDDNKTTNNKNNNNTSSNGVQKEETVNKNIPSKYELKSLGDLQYYLYTPSNPVDNMPLIMYLHGGTNKKSSVESLLTTDGFPKYLYDGYYGNLRAYVVIPKLTNNYTGWADISDNLKNLIKSISTNYGIDTNKVSLTGHSMGGTGTYQVQVKLPNTFACIAPMSGSIRNTEENLNALSKTKIWAFVGTNDTIVDPTSTRTIIESLKNKGANVRLTEFDGTDHFGVPSLGYKNSEFINWLVNCGK